MAEYFLIHDRSVFEDKLRPALAAAWRQRSFDPCIPLCREWAARARDYADRYRINPSDIVLLQLEQGLYFDRAIWRTIVGELLLFAACEIPEFSNCFDTFLHLLEPSTCSVQTIPRESRPEIHQALFGSRELAFGTALYRPEHAGWNDTTDTSRLSDWLSSIPTEAWTTNDLVSLPGLDDEEDRAEELVFAREWFAVLADLYRRTASAGRIVILESIF